ncbi:DMT family transporter [Acerihabitans sp. KWT182]|uniref:DMT family transporter n=1 Tax=Acerihabitans sp. KWT182 TaxID=3157919 RepID=A0AAU7QFZ4_9GAMM
MTEKQAGTAQLSIAMLLSGTIGYFVIASGQSPINVVFARCVVGSVCLIIYCLYAKLFNKSYLTAKNVGLMIIVGLSIVLNWIALFSSYKYASIGVTTTLYHVAPFIVFFGGAFLFKEGISKYRLTWLLIAFLGVVLIGDPENQNIAVSSSYLLGCGLALIAATLYATATLASKHIKNIPPHVIALSQMLIGVVVLSPFAEFSQLSGTAWQWSCLLILGVVHSAFMYILIYASYKKLQTATIAIISYIYPVVAVIVDYFAFGHVFSLLQIIGGILILAAGLCGTLNLNPLTFKKANNLVR